MEDIDIKSENGVLKGKCNIKNYTYEGGFILDNTTLGLLFIHGQGFI